MSSFRHHTTPSNTHCFFFNDTATTEIYTLSLHDALPISSAGAPVTFSPEAISSRCSLVMNTRSGITPLSSATILLRSEEHTSELSHLVISYAVFCLKKKKNNELTSMITHHPVCSVRRRRP